MSKKEVVKKDDNALAISSADLDEWGGQEVSSNDIMISKILPMQGMSKLVMDRKAQLGEYRDSVTGELLGSIDEPMEFIPFHVERLWLVQREVNGKFEFQGFEPITRQNEDRQWEMTVNGEKMRYDWNYMFYVLLPKDIEDGIPTPYIVNFRRTSVKGGKKLMTQMFVRNRQAGKTPASMAMKLNGKLQQNDKGTFVVLDVSASREASNEEVMAALEMFKIVKAGEAKVDHSDVVKPSKPEQKKNMEF